MMGKQAGDRWHHLGTGGTVWGQSCDSRRGLMRRTFASPARVAVTAHPAPQARPGAFCTFPEAFGCLATACSSCSALLPVLCPLGSRTGRHRVPEQSRALGWSSPRLNPPPRLLLQAVCRGAKWVTLGVSCAGTAAGLGDPCGSLPAQDVPRFGCLRWDEVNHAPKAPAPSRSLPRSPGGCGVTG